MKLNEKQINTIDTILEKKGVVYIDYKFEILDHIATEVENLMKETPIGFQDALAIVLEKWSPKLKKTSSRLFGFLWLIPEILMGKAKKLYWQKMLKLFVATAILTPILLFFKEYFSGQTNFIFYFIFTIIGVQLLGYFAIVISKQKTTFGFLFKQQFIAFVGLYCIGLYSLNSNPQIFDRPIYDVFPIFLMIALLVLAPISNFNYLKEHFNQLKRN